MPSIAKGVAFGSTTIGGNAAIFRHQRNFTPAAFQAFDRHFFAQARDDDLPAARLGALVHDEEVAVQDADVLHAGAAHAQQVVGVRLEQRGVDAVLRLDVLGGEDRTARGHPAHQRQRALQRHAGDVLQAQAARGAGRDFQRALLRQRLQMVLRRAGGGKAQSRGDLGTRGRHAKRFDVAADPVEDLLLAGREARRHDRRRPHCAGRSFAKLRRERGAIGDTV